MAANGRGAMRPQSKSPPFLVIGLLVALVILGANYWSLSSSNRSLSVEMSDLQDQIRMISAKKINAEKRSDSVMERVKELEKSISDNKMQIAKKETEISSLNQQHSDRTTELESCGREKEQCQTSLKSCEENTNGIQQELQKVKEELEELKKKDSSKPENTPNCDSVCSEKRTEILNAIEKSLGLAALQTLQGNGIDIGEFKDKLQNQQGQQPAGQQPGQQAVQQQPGLQLGQQPGQPQLGQPGQPPAEQQPGNQPDAQPGQQPAQQQPGQQPAQQQPGQQPEQQQPGQHPAQQPDQPTPKTGEQSGQPLGNQQNPQPPEANVQNPNGSQNAELKPGTGEDNQVAKTNVPMVTGSAVVIGVGDKHVNLSNDQSIKPVDSKQQAQEQNTTPIPQTKLSELGNQVPGAVPPADAANKPESEKNDTKTAEENANPLNQIAPPGQPQQNQPEKLDQAQPNPNVLMPPGDVKKIEDDKNKPNKLPGDKDTYDDYEEDDQKNKEGEKTKEEKKFEHESMLKFQPAGMNELKKEENGIDKMQQNMDRLNQ